MFISRQVNPAEFIDAYKSSHQDQYPPGTTQVTSNFTPRASRIPGIDAEIFFGLQAYYLKWFDHEWRHNFFGDKHAPKRYAKIARHVIDQDVTIDHIEGLHKLGYLPLRVRALPEGTAVPMRVSAYTIQTTKDEFAWLANFVETQMSAEIWGPCTSATISDQYRFNFDYWAAKTSDTPEFAQFQGHDFSMRGMFMCNASAASGAAHLLSSVGTDTFPAIRFLQDYYGANLDTELVGCSVRAAEHATACAGARGPEGELENLRRLLTKVYPNKIFSYVSDTYDFWELVGAILPKLRNEVLTREGKLVIRPDSGDPVKILLGNPSAENRWEKMGLIESLWEIFGGITNHKGFKVLNPKIGAIYGDSITLDRQVAILSGLAAKGFASTNVVLGIGSYTYQYVTRDTFGNAIKATHTIQNGEPVELYKAPKTDSGIKNSARGLVKVIRDNDGKLIQLEQQTQAQVDASDNEQKIVFEDGEIHRFQELKDIRKLMSDQRLLRLKSVL